MYLEKFPYNIPIKSKKYPESIPAFIEVSQGSRMKYEWCHKKKSLELIQNLIKVFLMKKN